MHHKPSFFLAITLLCTTTPLLASSVQRCEDTAGNITFTSLGCPTGDKAHWQKTFNAPPGTVTPMLPTVEQPSRSSGNRNPTPLYKDLVVVGQRDDGCGNRLNAEERRRATINQQTPPGMTRKDVESLLGRPDRVVSRNGETRYVYNEKKGRSSQVTFDENGCVKGKR